MNEKLEARRVFYKTSSIFTKAQKFCRQFQPVNVNLLLIAAKNVYKRNLSGKSNSVKDFAETKNLWSWFRENKIMCKFYSFCIFKYALSNSSTNSSSFICRDTLVVADFQVLDWGMCICLLKEPSIGIQMFR